MPDKPRLLNPKQTRCGDCGCHPSIGRHRLTIIGDAFPDHTGETVERELCRYCLRARERTSYIKVEAL